MSLPAAAQTDALQSSVPSVQLGTLLLSPVQRRNLEFVRKSTQDASSGSNPGDTLLDPNSGLPNVVKISGVVLRSGNKSTVWINNQPLYGETRAGALGELAARVGIVTNDRSNMKIKSKPGQTIDIPTQQTTDLLPPGSIKIIPPKAGSNVGTKKE